VKKDATALPRLNAINRQQLVLRTVDVERLIDEDHSARLIWELMGRLDLSLYHSDRRRRGSAGPRAHRSTAIDQCLAIRLQPGDQLGAGGSTAVRV
jgi:hypothetical protein